MREHIDEAWRHRLAMRVDALARRIRGVSADIGDAVPLDSDVTDEGLTAAAIVDRPSGGQDVVAGGISRCPESPGHRDPAGEEDCWPPAVTRLHDAFLPAQRTCAPAPFYLRSPPTRVCVASVTCSRLALG